MSSSLFGLLELLLVFGLVTWFGIAQLRAVRRDRPDGRPSRRDGDDDAT